MDPGNDHRTGSKLMANLDNNGIFSVYNVLQFSNPFPILPHILTITLGNSTGVFLYLLFMEK